MFGLGRGNDTAVVRSPPWSTTRASAALKAKDDDFGNASTFGDNNVDDGDDDDNDDDGDDSEDNDCCTDGLFSHDCVNNCNDVDDGDGDDDGDD